MGFRDLWNFQIGIRIPHLGRCQGTERRRTTYDLACRVAGHARESRIDVLDAGARLVEVGRGDEDGLARSLYRGEKGPEIRSDGIVVI